MDKWWNTPLVAWAFTAIGTGGGVMLAFVSPYVGIPIGAVIFIIGIVLLIRAYRLKGKDESKTQQAESKETTNIKVENPQYYIVEQGKHSVELQVIIKYPNPPHHLANIHLIIAGKTHDFTKIEPPFQAEINTKAVSYSVWYEMPYHDFLLGRERKPDGTDSTKVEDLGKGGKAHFSTYDFIGQVLATVDGEPILSYEFEIKHR